MLSPTGLVPRYAGGDAWGAPGGTIFEKNLGIGNDDGAGDAWKVGPAYACLAGVIVLL